MDLRGLILWILVDPVGGSVCWIHVDLCSGSWCISLVVPGGSGRKIVAALVDSSYQWILMWILVVEPIAVDPGKFQLWILVDLVGGSYWWILVVDPGGLNWWILVDPSGGS